MAQVQHGMPLPTFRTRGTHREIGRSIGSRFAERIRHVVKVSVVDLAAEGLELPTLREQTEPYLLAVERVFPDLLAELAGIAEGAGVPLEILFHLNCHGLCPPRARLADAELPPDHCTSMASRGADGVVVGHTEDGPPSAIDDLYLLAADITGETSFLALNYVQNLAGCAAAMNAQGLILVADGVPERELRVGVPRDFLSRAVLRMDSIDAALELLQSVERGGSLNCLLAQDARIVNVEVTPGRVAITEATEVGWFVHTNHFLDAELAEGTEVRPDSAARLRRGRELMHPEMSVAEMKQLLSDRVGFPDSICRARTLAAFVANSRRREIQTCWGEPDTGRWTTHRL